jgi:hypothetical protein
MLRKHDRQSSIPALSFTCAAVSPHSRSTLRIFATCLMFLLLSHMPASADHVHQLYYNNSQWQDQDLTALTGGGIAFSEGAIAAFHAPGKQLHVYYIDANLHVRQLMDPNRSKGVNELDSWGDLANRRKPHYGLLD